MKTEFKLSDKIAQFSNDSIGVIPVKDVKEFIRLLKEEFDKNRSHHEGYIRKVIDKLAGDLEWMKYSKK